MKTAKELNINDKILFQYEKHCTLGKVIEYRQCWGMGSLEFGEYGILFVQIKNPKWRKQNEIKEIQIITYENYPFIIINKEQNQC